MHASLHSGLIVSQPFHTAGRVRHNIRPRPLVRQTVSSNSVQEQTGAAASTSGNSAVISFLGAGGQKVDVECGLDEYILDAGIKAGLELPYTCRGGICGACVAKLTRGKVDQSDVEDLSFTLSEDEIEEGMTLICMAKPLSDCSLETQSDWGYSLGVCEWQGATGKITGGKVEPLMGKKWDDIAEGEEAQQQ